MGHDLTDRLGKTLGALNGIRIDGGVQSSSRVSASIRRARGLDLSVQHRKLVAKFDWMRRKAALGQDAQAQAAEAGRAGDQRAAPVAEPPAPPRHDQAHPARAGSAFPEKLKSIQERFGLAVEWHEIDHDNPRASQSLLAKVRAGKVGVVVFLEGVMRHGTWKPTSEACNIMSIPYAMADKAGTASLQQAFDELERKLSTSGTVTGRYTRRKQVGWTSRRSSARRTSPPSRRSKPTPRR